MRTTDHEIVLEHRVRARALKARMFGLDGPPIRVGRYRVEAVLGAGAMGVVYAARDDRLDRRVAVKVLRPELVLGAARLEREARALARLSHPNVVTIHEVGEDDGRTFLVMEHVEGCSLRAWLVEPRTLAARLDVLAQAARGLAAAHGLGLVHRDFKPDNAIVGADGRVRIVDFGLATAPDEDDTQDGGAPIDAAALHSRITQTGQLIGTPAYLAPELLGGARPSARSDQFAFACAAWEVLYGEHPIAPGRPRDRVPSPPAGVRLPRGIAAAIERGLHPDPRERHADLDAFARVLAPQRGRVRVVAVGGGALVLGAVLTAVVIAASRSPTTPEHEVIANDALIDVGEAPKSSPAACSETPAFDRPWLTLERSLVMLHELERATTASADEDPSGLADVRKAVVDAELALGHHDDACRGLDRLLADLPGHEPSQCWRAAYCESPEQLPARARCRAGDVASCGRVSIKHEYEFLEASAAAKRGDHDQAGVLRQAHLDMLLEVFDRGCELGDTELCEQLARYGPAGSTAPR